MRKFIEHLTEGRELPAGYDTFGFKIVRPDLRSYNDYRWPWPGNAVTDYDAIASDNPCPVDRTGGFCIARTLRGAASGGHGHAAILLLAYNQADILASNEDKLRVRHAFVVDLIDAVRIYRDCCETDLQRADLQRADLRGADLQRANLQGADLQGADLQRADLRGAYLRRADLQRADLQGADLRGAYLQEAYLQEADLRGAYLQRAYLQEAYLQEADLQRADLRGAYLRRADLQRADLQGADLRGADLQGAIGIPVKA